MRLGGPIFAKTNDPESWVAAVRAEGYRAAFCPVAPDADVETIKAYAAAASKADIVIAEVGAWSNPLGPDPAEAKAAIEKCIYQDLLHRRAKGLFTLFDWTQTASR